MDEIPEMLKGIFKQLEKLDQLPNMSKEIRSLRDHVSAIDDRVLTYRRELDQVKKKQNDLDHEIHTLQHSGEKPFQGNYCDKAFLRHYALLRHIKTHSEIQHTGEKPFQCNYCDKAFLSKHTITHILLRNSFFYIYVIAQGINSLLDFFDLLCVLKEPFFYNPLLVTE